MNGLSSKVLIGKRPMLLTKPMPSQVVVFNTISSSGLWVDPKLPWKRSGFCSNMPSTDCQLPNYIRLIVAALVTIRRLPSVSQLLMLYLAR
ncbi:hypothetical protein H9L39_07176 [Fusarium oxysporum f. sp. albedinis]|nr:hypothetical protein H9L39_07176 [Fusarium oxysporum f. sp. albedinis]